MSDEGEHEPIEAAAAPPPAAALTAEPAPSRTLEPVIGPFSQPLYRQPATAAAAPAEETWTFGARPKAEPPSLRTWEALWLGLATGASLLFAPIGFVAAILSPMVFDPHQNLWNPAAWIAFFLIISFWMVCIAAPYGAWVAFLRRMRMLTWLAMAAPLVWVAAAVASVNFLPG